MMDTTEISSEITPVKATTPSCCVCKENPVKYRCPRCFVQTCGLVCVKQHKIDAACSGIRDKTGYIAMKNFTDTSLLNDYRFLEEGGRRSDNAGRDFLPKCKRIPKRLHQLIRQARHRGIDLKLLPYPMTKRKMNSSFYMFRTKQILWHVEWCFPQAGETYTDKHVKECTPLDEELDKYIHPTKSDPIKRHKLQKYVSAGLESCQLYLKVEGLPANMIRYHRLDAHKSVTDNLSGKCIVEFPKIYVVLGSSDSVYPVMTDEEERDLWKSARRYNIQMNKNHEKGVSSEQKDKKPSPVQKECSNGLQTAPMQEECSKELQTAPVREECSHGLQTAPMQEECSKELQTAPVREECSEELQTAPMQKECSKELQTAPMQEECSKELQTAPMQEECSEELQTAPMQEECSKELQTAPVREECSEELQTAPMQEECSKELQTAPVREECSKELQTASVREECSQELQAAPMQEECSKELQTAPMQEEYSKELQTAPMLEECSKELQTAPMLEECSKELQTAPVREECSEELQTAPLQEECLKELQTAPVQE